MAGMTSKEVDASYDVGPSIFIDPESQPKVQAPLARHQYPKAVYAPENDVTCRDIVVAKYKCMLIGFIVFLTLAEFTFLNINQFMVKEDTRNMTRVFIEGLTKLYNVTSL